MLGFITKLQRKPERVRRQFAITLAAAGTALIALLWLASLGVSVQRAASAAPLRTAEEKSPLAALSEAVGAVVFDAQTLIREVRGVFGNRGTEAGPEPQSAAADGARR